MGAEKTVSVTVFIALFSVIYEQNKRSMITSTGIKSFFLYFSSNIVLLRERFYE
jgi:hypothetical protein